MHVLVLTYYLQGEQCARFLKTECHVKLLSVGSIFCSIFVIKMAVM